MSRCRCTARAKGRAGGGLSCANPAASICPQPDVQFGSGATFQLKGEDHTLANAGECRQPCLAALVRHAGGKRGCFATFPTATRGLSVAVRFMLNKDPNVEFTGYSIPHPSEQVVNVRVQVTRLGAAEALGLLSLLSAYSCQRELCYVSRTRALIRCFAADHGAGVGPASPAASPAQHQGRVR